MGIKNKRGQGTLTPFEHIMITSSIVLGLAIAQLLTGFADSLRMREVKLYWPHTMWVLAQLISCIQWGFAVWVFEARSTWMGYQLFLFILTPILVYLVARFTYPHPIEKMSLKEHYFESKRYTYGLAIGILVVSFLVNIVLSNVPTLTADIMLRGVMAITLLILATSNNETMHKVLVPMLLLTRVLIMLITRIVAA